MKRQMSLEENPEQRNNTLQITGIQNQMTHTDSPYGFIHVPAIIPREKQMMDPQAMLNRKMDNDFLIIAEFILQKLKNYPPQIRNIVQQSISNVFIEADKNVLN